MYQEIIKKIKPEFEKTLAFLKQQNDSLRTSRISPSLIENIEVNVYDSVLPLKQLGAILTSGPRTLTVQPWDKNILKQIETAINSGRGVSAIIEGDILRIDFFPLNQEQREEFKKTLNQFLEQCRITLRLLRDKAWKEINQLFQEGKIREDDKFRAKDELQDLIAQYFEKLDELKERKEKEIMEI